MDLSSCLRSRSSSVGDQCPQPARIVNQDVLTRRALWPVACDASLGLTQAESVRSAGLVYGFGAQVSKRSRRLNLNQRPPEPRSAGLKFYQKTPLLYLTSAVRRNDSGGETFRPSVHPNRRALGEKFGRLSVLRSGRTHYPASDRPFLFPAWRAHRPAFRRTTGYGHH